MDPVWRLHAQARLHWRQWDDEWTVFDDGSGQTHLMDALTAMAVMALELEPASVPQLAARFVEEAGEGASHEVRMRFETTLQDTFTRLAAADLIEPASE